MRVIRHLDHFRLLVERDHDHDGTEHFFSINPPGVVDARDHGRTGPIARRILFRYAAGQEGRTFRSCLLQEATDFPIAFGIDDGSHIGVRVQSVPNLEFLNPRNYLRHHFVPDVLVNERTGSCRTTLALPRKAHRADDLVCRCRGAAGGHEIREHDRRGFAAEFQRDFCDPVSGGMTHKPPDLRRTGK